jgi:hypothetical protein
MEAGFKKAKIIIRQKLLKAMYKLHFLFMFNMIIALTLQCRVKLFMLVCKAVWSVFYIWMA